MKCRQSLRSLGAHLLVIDEANVAQFVVVVYRAAQFVDPLLSYVIVGEIQVCDAIVDTQHRCKMRGAKIGQYVFRKIQDTKSRVL